jgi:hypothetical protein
MISYSQIIKKTDHDNDDHDNDDHDSHTNTNLQKDQTIEKTSSNVVIKYINPIKYHDQIMLIKPYSKNIYSKYETYKWLHHKIDNNYFHYDYCIKLFEMLMKWVKLNNFKIAISEDILLAKFISLMYLLSNKQGYK